MSETALRLLAEHAQDVIYRYRVFPSYAMEYISPSATHMFGISPEAFYADPEIGFTLIHEDDRDTAFRMRATPADYREPIRLRWRRPDGTFIWVEHRNVPIYDETGRLIAIEGIGREITQIVAVKQRLRSSEAQMRALVKRLQSLREEERTTLARELHDELGQLLTTIKIELDRIAEASSRGAHKDIAALVQSANSAIELANDSVRRMSRELRPPALDQLGLAAAIEMEAAAAERRTGIRFRVSAPQGALNLDRDRSTGVFRIVQEAFTNIIRHSNASAVRVRMIQTPRVFRLSIQDNGRGISTSELVDPGSLGLLGMRERASVLGGAVMITGRPGSGTTVVIAIPLRAKPKGKERVTRVARR